MDLTTAFKIITYTLWGGLALYIAIVDYRTRLIDLLQLIIFALLGILIIFIQEKTLYDTMFIAGLPLLIFGLGQLTKSLNIGGADWIFFPAFLVFFNWDQSVLVFMLSIFIMTVLSQTKRQKNKLFETPFITILVFSGLLVQGASYV